MKILLVVALLILSVTEVACKKSSTKLSSLPVTSIPRTVQIIPCNIKNLSACPTYNPSYEVTFHPRFGEIAVGEISILFNKDIGPEQAWSVIEPLGADIVAYLDLTNRYTIKLRQIPTEDEFTTIVENLRKNVWVRTATPNQIQGPGGGVIGPSVEK